MDLNFIFLVAFFNPSGGLSLGIDTEEWLLHGGDSYGIFHIVNVIRQSHGWRDASLCPEATPHGLN